MYLDRNDSETLQIVAICCAVLHNRVEQEHCVLPDTDDPVVGSDANNAVIEPGQGERVVLKQASKDDIEAGRTKN